MEGKEGKGEPEGEQEGEGEEEEEGEGEGEGGQSQLKTLGNYHNMCIAHVHTCVYTYIIGVHLD